MKSQIIADDHHVSRYVRPSQIDETLTGVRKANSHVFLPRADYPRGSGPEKFVSVDWLEYFYGDLRQQLNAISNVLREVRGFRVSPEGGFAIVQVENIKKSSLDRPILVKTLGEKHDPSHSGIHGLTPEDTVIAQKIANSAILEDVYG